MNSLSKVVIRASEISCPKTEGQPSSHSSDKLVQTIQQDGVTSGGEASISPKSPELGGGAASSTDDFMGQAVRRRAHKQAEDGEEAASALEAPG
ncbi:PCS1 [Symbiodinium microadriaticum]|nr:PCS1 [Symbiodinium microadriaticum]